MKYFRLLLSGYLVLVAGFCQANPYTLGNGYNIGRWNFSGYTSSGLFVPVQPQGLAELKIDDLAIFAQAKLHRYINPFIEVEYANQLLWAEKQGAFSSTGDFILERLYNDMYWGNGVILRWGKMLAPVGEWNQIHANPLVATTIRPLTTYFNFSEFISGLSLNYVSQFRWLPSVQLYYQPWREWLPEPLASHPVRYNEVSGINLKYGDEFSGQLGLSIQHAVLSHRSEQQIRFGLDGFYDFNWVKLRSHVFYTTISGTRQRQRNQEWGGYLQLLIPVSEQFNAVIRGESVTQRNQLKSHQNAVFGLNYRPDDAIVWKVEYAISQGAKLAIREGLFASFGVIF